MFTKLSLPILALVLLAKCAWVHAELFKEIPKDDSSTGWSSKTESEKSDLDHLKTHSTDKPMASENFEEDFISPFLELCTDCPKRDDEDFQRDDLRGYAVTLVDELQKHLDEKSTNCTCTQGPKGDKGVQGERGLPGSSIKGHKGDKGDSLMGPRGLTGPQGPPGLPGEIGNKGSQGFMGVQGKEGDSTPGVAGSKGDPGDCIATCVEGPEGPQGPAGKGFFYFNSLPEMKRQGKTSIPGSIAYVEETGRFYGRTPHGWGMLLMHSTDSSYTPRRFTSERYERSKSRLAQLKKSNRLAKRNEVQLADGLPEERNAVNRLRLVALNEPWSGNMRGIDFINYQCQREAMDAKIYGTFRAFLSSSGLNIKSLIHSDNTNYSIVNIRNETLYSSWSDVFLVPRKYAERKTGSHLRNPLYSFNGKNLLDDNWPSKQIWHGSHVSGRASLHNCKTWTTNDDSVMGKAARNKNVPCSDKLIVLCIEIPERAVSEYLADRFNFNMPEKSADSSNESRSPVPNFSNITSLEYKQFIQYYDS